MTGPENGVRATLDDHDRRIDRLELHEPAVINERVRILAEDVHMLRGEMRSIRRALWAFLTSVVIVAISVEITVLLRAG